MPLLPDWLGSIALWEHITMSCSRAEKPSEGITSFLFLMNIFVQAPRGTASEHVCGVHVRPQVCQQPEQALQTIPQETFQS